MYALLGFIWFVCCSVTFSDGKKNILCTCCFSLQWDMKAKGLHLDLSVAELAEKKEKSRRGSTWTVYELFKCNQDKHLEVKCYKRIQELSFNQQRHSIRNWFNLRRKHFYNHHLARCDVLAANTDEDKCLLLHASSLTPFLLLWK